MRKKISITLLQSLAILNLELEKILVFGSHNLLPNNSGQMLTVILHFPQEKLMKLLDYAENVVREAVLDEDEIAGTCPSFFHQYQMDQVPGWELANK